MDAGDDPVPVLRWPRYPYPGLRPFQITAEADESLIFYGRDRHKDEIIGRLGRAHLVMVIGPSGCGKSSLIKAGVIPALEAGFLAKAGERWRTAQMRPGRRPIAELARAFARVAVPQEGTEREEAAAQLEELLRSGPSGLWLATGHLRDLGALHAADAGSERLLVLLDQFEELFGPQIEDKQDVDDFVGLLVRFFEKPHQDLYVVVTMRTGYIGDAANFVGLAELLNATMYLTPVLNREELREAITLPAADYGGEVEPELVEAMLADMGTGTEYDADHLPLLQHALLWLWLRALPPGAMPVHPGADRMPETPIHLTLAAYQEHGRLRGILDCHAEQVLAEAVRSDPDKLGPVVEILLRRLTERDLGARYRRSPTQLVELQRLTGRDVRELAALVVPFVDPSASFMELRPPGAAPESMLDVSHESLIRQWPRLRAWADAESELRHRFRRLEELASEWIGSGRRLTSTVRGSNLALARRWYDATQPYRAQPGALEAWVRSKRHADNGDWAQSFGGPGEAVDALYGASLRASWLRRGLWMSAPAAVLLGLGIFAYYGAKMVQEQQLTRLADLYGVAVANRDLPIGTLPPERRATAYQELAVLLAALEDPDTAGSTQSHRNRLRALEGEADRTVRQVLGRTLATVAPESSPSIDRWRGVVGECVRRVDPGRRRQVVQVALAPLGAAGSAGADAQPVFAMLTQIDNRPHLETVQFEKLALGYSFSPTFAPSFCRIGHDRTPLDVTGAADVAMDPSAGWLVERPATSRGDASATARVRQLDWFRICARPDQKGSCAPSDRQWHVELHDLGPNVDLQAPGLIPRAADGMPAVAPVFLAGEEAAALAAGFDHPVAATPLRTEPTETAVPGAPGDALYWRDALLVPPRPGFRIPAFAFAPDRGLLAFVATTLAPNARAAATSQGPTSCDGQELCTHYVRVLHLGANPERQDGDLPIPLLDVAFVGPPLDRLAFGTGAHAGELLFRFPGVDGAARLAWDRPLLKSWLCRDQVAGSTVPAVGGYTQAFENLVSTSGDSMHAKSTLVQRACRPS